MGEDIFYMFLTFIINVISQIVAYQIVKILELHNKNKSKKDVLFPKKGKDTSFLFSLLRIPFQTKTRPVSRFPALFQTIYNNYFAGFQELFRPTI